MGGFSRTEEHNEKRDYRLSTTESYHKDTLGTLGWELTVCNCLYQADVPVRRILASRASYGQLLCDHLERFIPLKTIRKVIEIGGGYGYLMKDLLERNRQFRPCMLDISPVLLERQKETLKGYEVLYRLENALETGIETLRQYELAILNENLGDFPTIVDLDSRVVIKDSFSTDDQTVRNVRRYFDTYGLEPPAKEIFNLNIGAMEMIERLCLAGVPYIFAGEHSCEARAPNVLKPYMSFLPDGNPRRIPLMGHDEYTIKFSYLQKIAGYHGYKTVRGPFADYIVPNLTEELKAILASRGLYSDNEEAICHFVEDLYEYEYLILVKENNQKQR